MTPVKIRNGRYRIVQDDAVGKPVTYFSARPVENDRRPTGRNDKGIG